MLPALLFDLDGTLVDSAADIARALTLVRMARGGGALDAAIVRPLVSQGAATLVAVSLGDLAGDPDDDLREFRQQLQRLSPDPGIIYPGVCAALQHFRQHGHAMGVVTNKPEGLARALLAALDLDRSFDIIVGGDTAALPKPDRAPIDHALAAINAAPHDAILIGDSEVDAAAAEACAMPFLLYQGGYGAASCPDRLVSARFDHFDRLPMLISAVVRSF